MMFHSKKNETSKRQTIKHGKYNYQAKKGKIKTYKACPLKQNPEERKLQVLSLNFLMAKPKSNLEFA